MYEIPQQLEYKEKIIFGLTFEQLLYAMIFLPVVIIIFRLNMNLYVKLTIISFPVSLATGFMFFNFKTIIKNWIGWYKHRKIETKEFEKILGIKGVGKNWVINSKGKRIAILKVNTINFSIKPANEKEAIISSFQKFLNSLDFPTQILMNTESINLDDYLNSLKSRVEKDQFADLYIKYKTHLEETINTNKIMNRVFYFIIPEETDIKIQVGICFERLGSLNLKAKLLNQSEIISLFNSFLGENLKKILNEKTDDEEEEKKVSREDKKSKVSKIKKFFCILKNIFNTIRNPSIIRKWIALKLLADIDKKPTENKKTEDKKPEADKDEQKYFINQKDYFQINDGQYQRIVYASGYPRYVESGFLDRIISSLGDFDLSIHIKPFPIESMLIGLNRELQKQRADLYSMGLKGITNPSLEIQNNDTRSTLENLQKGKERLFNVSLYINCKADTLKKLNLLTKKVESELNSLMILPKIPKFRMLQGFKSILPLGINELKCNRNITTEALSAFFPFTSQFLEADNGGVWLGLNRNNIPIIKDIFSLSNPNGVVLAQSGGGKSYFCKLLITRYMLNGTKVMIIDPQGEYKGIVSQFKGQTIDLSQKSDTMINPLDLMGHDYMEKRLSLMDLMKIMLGDLSDIQKAVIDKALTKTYASKGITENSDTWKDKPPILGDLLKTLNSMEKSASKLERSTISSLSNRLEMYVNGVFSFFNKATNINFENNLVCFDLGKMPSQVKPAVMFLVLDYIYMKMKANLDRKILLIDESWSLLSRTEEAGYIFEIVKTCRKFNLGLLLINQEVEGLLDSKAGKSVLANSSYTVLMRQKPAVIDNICKTFHLSSSERTHLLTAGIGEGLLIMEDDHTELKVIASPEEHKLITTKADEINEIKEEGNKKQKSRDVKINVDEFARFYKKSGLNKDEIKFLLDKGYKIEKRKSLVTNKEEDFLLQPRHNETTTHLFVIYDIAEYLEKKGIRVEKYATRKPDLVFELNGKSFAIEVETGGKIKKDPQMIKDKVAELKKNYYKSFFVVTGKENVSEYKKFLSTWELRYLKGKIDGLLKSPAP